MGLIFIHLIHSFSSFYQHFHWHTYIIWSSHSGPFGWQYFLGEPFFFWGDIWIFLLMSLKLEHQVQVWIIYRSRSRGTTVPWKRKCRDQSPLLPISLGWWLRWEIPTKMISTRELGLQQITPKTKPQTQTIKTWMINYQMTKNPTHPFSSKKVTPPPKKKRNVRNDAFFLGVSVWVKNPVKVWFFRWRLRSKRINWSSCVFIHPGVWESVVVGEFF